MARAMAVRCCWPPESSDGLRFSIGFRRRSSAAAMTRRSISALPIPATFSGEAMLS